MPAGGCKPNSDIGVPPSVFGHAAGTLTFSPCALQGQRWEQIKPHFEEFWSMTFRVLDDVKVLAPISHVPAA